MNPPAPPSSFVSGCFTFGKILAIVVSVILVFLYIVWPPAVITDMRSRESQARAMMNSLTTAISGYQTEYGHYPKVKGLHGNEKISTLHDSELVRCLMGDSPSSDPASDPNPRKIQFYNPLIAKDGKNGYDSKTGDLRDPWGQPLWILMDVEEKGHLDNPYYGRPDYPRETQPQLGLGCIVWDFGSDQIDGTKERSSDDLRSWH